jgi:magnesium chelatase family protein
VIAARAIQIERFSASTYRTNAGIAGADVRRWCSLDERATSLLRNATLKGHLSARALDRIARVARTIADLAGSKTIAVPHIAEAIGYRTLERRGIAA